MHTQAYGSGLSGSDYALSDALADDPRRPWSDVAQITGLTPVTARRRWQKLVDRGAAWITTYPGLDRRVVLSHVEVRCAPDSIARVAAHLSRHPRILSVSEVTGEYTFRLVVITQDVREFREVLNGHVAGGPGVLAVRSAAITRTYAEGSRWRALPQTPAPPASPAAEAPSPVSFTDPRALTVLRVLETDGRAGSAMLARDLGTSDAHARRLTRGMLRSGLLAQRVDLGLEASDWPHGLALHMIAPAHRLDEIAARIRSIPGTRLCIAVSGGPYNLYAILWLQDLAEAVDVEARLVAELDVVVADRNIQLHYHKRMGHLFDDDRRRVAHLSWTAEPGAEPTPVVVGSGLSHGSGA
ncbi:Lrp/AsnC family transcriptional regulator [Brevibacterium litoralis]|uniref:Lrp/AsnC family transcriptional regulator n=1 Tax=Brevibacterium litoralis TaxID=3138935 RepID=UPI0032EF5063